MSLGVTKLYFSSETEKPFDQIIKTCREDLYNVSCRAANEILEKLSANQEIDPMYQPFGDGHSAEKIIEIMETYKEK